MNEQDYTPEKTVLVLSRGNAEYYIDYFSIGPKHFTVTLHERQLSRFNTLGEAVEFLIEKIGKNSFIVREGYSQS